MAVDGQEGLILNRETITLFLAIWGAVTGTVAVFVNIFAFVRDKSRLKVTATMACGTSIYHGKTPRYFFRVRFTNRGRRIVRIHRVAIKTNGWLAVSINRFLFYRGWTKKAIGSDVGIYTADVDPIREIFTQPNTKKYPPGDITLQEHQTIELELVLNESLLHLIPSRNGTLIVTDQIGVKHKAHYLPLDCKNNDQKSEPSAPARSKTRLNQIILIATFIGFSWLAMQVVHELGHILGGIAGGGTIARVLLYPTVFSQTEVIPNPHPLFEVWSGAVFGAFLPLAIFLIATVLRCRGLYLFRFFAGFCLIANGFYLGVASIKGIADAGELLMYGSRQWQLILFGLVTVPLGLYLWNGQGSYFGLGEARGKVDRTATVVSLCLFVAVIGIELLAGNR